MTHRRGSFVLCCHGGGLTPPTQCPAQAALAATAAQLLHTLEPLLPTQKQAIQSSCPLVTTSLNGF